MDPRYITHTQHYSIHPLQLSQLPEIAIPNLQIDRNLIIFSASYLSYSGYLSGL